MPRRTGNVILRLVGGPCCGIKYRISEFREIISFEYDGRVADYKFREPCADGTLEFWFDGYSMKSGDEK